MFCFVNALASTNDCSWLAGNTQAKVLFENKGLQAKGETTLLQNSASPSQQKFFEFLGTQYNAAGGPADIIV
jgi:hypothetical protein